MKMTTGMTMGITRGLTAALVLFGMAGTTLAQPGAGGRRPLPPEARERVLEQFDADGDGQLNEAERQAARAGFEARRAEKRAELLERFDADGDGELNETERAAAREEIGPGLKERFGGRHGRHHGGRDGERHEAFRRHMLERFDTDGDGTLSEAERAEARAFAQQKKAELVEQFDADGDGRLTGEERRAAGGHVREMHQLDANHDGAIDALDVQALTERAASGGRIPDANKDGVHDAADVAALIERIKSRAE
jgi:Ca2+-binding EF-hand superfamily protein